MEQCAHKQLNGRKHINTAKLDSPTPMPYTGGYTRNSNSEENRKIDASYDTHLLMYLKLMG